jgi:hypothetical protein
MSALKFYRATKQEKLNVFDSVARLKKLKPYAIEKDWWVVQTLNVIFNLDVAQHLLFKGGTSLSKAWQLINRFSEDIDLALNRTYLGFDAGLISKSQVKKLRETSFEFVTTTFYEALQKAFAEKGYTDVTFGFENLGDGDQDPVSILIYYPAVTEHSAYVLPRVKVELGSRSLKEPFTHCKIQSFVGEQFPKHPFADSAIAIPCVNPERTFLEKLFLLHEEFQKPQEKIRVARLSRHLYDITKIYNSMHKNKAYNQELIVSIVEHRKRFNGMQGVDYDTLYPPNLNPIPPDDFINAWQTDYKTMQTNMIPEDSPSFKDLLETVKQATQEYNALTFK